MSNDLELFKFARLYLGQANWDLVKKTSQKELEMFKKKPVDANTSYLVYGNKDLLSKFRAFYLTRCLKKRPLYEQYLMYDYATELCTNTRDEYGINVDLDLVFLYRHKHLLEIGRSEDWLIETILNKVANRNRDGLVTVILSEVHMSALETCGELKVINLVSMVANKNKSKVLNNVSTDLKSNVSGDYNVY